MKVLIVGGGGREHALLWKLRQDAPDGEFYVLGGNGGTQALAQHVALNVHDCAGVAAWARLSGIDLVVVGPEGPLAEGLVDALEAAGVPAFGPTRDAARIESSKAYAKALMQRAGVPTAAFAVFDSFDAAAAWIRSQGAPIVVKASGLAAGKGAVVCTAVDEALAAARDMLSGSFGEAGNEIVVEEFMEGEELSLFALCDGEIALPMVGVQDHKRIGEGDVGPNTGGMGAYAPVSTSTPALIERVVREIFEPVLAAMRADGTPFRGLLYAGLMLTDSGPRVVEFNCRFGDPETQVVLPLMASSLIEPMLRVARKESLRGMSLDWRDAAALTTVLAADGYPGDVHKGDVISLPAEHPDNVLVFHAGTRVKDGALVTNGGRVLAVTAVAATLADAATQSREVAASISFDGKQYRRDIGWRELQRAPGSSTVSGTAPSTDA